MRQRCDRFILPLCLPPSRVIEPLTIDERDKAFRFDGT